MVPSTEMFKEKSFWKWVVEYASCVPLSVVFFFNNNLFLVFAEDMVV